MSAMGRPQRLLTLSQTGLFYAAASRFGAQPVLWIFSLRALAVSEMPREQEIWCRRAAERAVIHADCGEVHTSYLRVAKKISRL